MMQLAPLFSAGLARVVLATAALLSIPLLAMQATDAVAWDAADFVVAGGLLFATGCAYLLAAHHGRRAGYRLAAGIALVAALLLIWTNLAVGLIGRAGDPANLMYLGVLAIGMVGAALSRLRARGMACTLAAMALAQILIALIAIAGGLGLPASPPLEILAVNSLFVALFAVSAWLFRRSA